MEPETMDIDLGKFSIKIMKARDLDHEKGIERKRFRQKTYFQMSLF